MSLQKFEEMGAAYLNDAQLCSAICGASEEKIKAALAVYPLSVLGSCSTQSLKEFGITKTQAFRLKAALCLYARVPVDTERVTCSRDAASKIRPKLAHLETEEFWVLAMSQANKVISMQRVSSGGIAATIVDVRMVAKVAISTPKCVGVILAHNHPSGNLKPSQADIVLTQKLKNGLLHLDIAVLDHIIITPEGGYYSFADEGAI